METTLDPDEIQGKIRLLATQVFALSTCASNMAEAVLTKDDTHRTVLIERAEGDLSQLQKSLHRLIRSL